MAAQQDTTPKFLAQRIHHISQALLSIVLACRDIQDKPAPETAFINI